MTYNWLGFCEWEKKKKKNDVVFRKKNKMKNKNDET